MTSRTRYFVIASLLVVLIGLECGLVAYYVGFPTSAFFAGDGPDDSSWCRRMQLVALRTFTKLHDLQCATAPGATPCRRVFQTVRNSSRNETGINVETDIDRVVACLSRSSEGSRGAPAAPRSSLPAWTVRCRADRGADAGITARAPATIEACASSQAPRRHAHPGGLRRSRFSSQVSSASAASLVRAARSTSRTAARASRPTTTPVKLVRSLGTRQRVGGR